MGFLLAAAGSAVGLGNIWRFTYIMGDNGGAAFILVYLVCIVLIGVPVFLAELVIGRASRRSAVGAFRKLVPGEAWVAVGFLGVSAGFLVLTFYSVVAGWILYYLALSASGAIAGLDGAQEATSLFERLSADGLRSTMMHGLFMVLTVAVVARGVRGGIERLAKAMMPALFLLLAVLIVRGLTLEGASAGVDFLLRPDLAKLTPAALLTAMGHAFFTLSAGMGAMITYGSYLSRDTDIPRASLQVAGLDTCVAIAAGFAIFPALFALGVAPGQGPGLIFVTLPLVFSKIAGGGLFATVFFLLVFVAAITSSVSMLEVVVAYFIDERGWNRKRAAFTLGGIIFVAGIPSAMAYGPLSGWSIATLLGAGPEDALASIGILGMNWFDLVTHIVSDYMLPVGGLSMALFLGWRWSAALSWKTIHEGRASFRLFGAWLELLRWVVPLVIGQVLILGIVGEFSAEKFPRVATWAAAVQPWFVGIAAAAALVAVTVGLTRRYEPTVEDSAG